MLKCKKKKKKKKKNWWRHTLVLYAKVCEPIRMCDSDFRDVRAMCSREVTSDFQGVLTFRPALVLDLEGWANIRFREMPPLSYFKRMKNKINSLSSSANTSDFQNSSS